MLGGKMNTKWTKTEIVYVSSLITIYAIFNVLLINKYFSVTEGWFQDYSRYILNGQVPYRDFYLFIPPLFPLLMTGISIISNNLFIAFRYYGFIERMILVFLVYCILRRAFNYKIIFISLLTGAVIYISNVQDIFYGYYQSSLLLATIMILIIIKLYENFDDRYIFYSTLFGFIAAITTLFKHPTGFLLLLSLLTSFVLITYKKDFAKSLKCCAISIATYILILSAFFIGMMSIGAFVPMMQQLFGGASSKGSILVVLFGFLNRVAAGITIKYLIMYILLILINIIYNKYIQNKVNLPIFFKRISQVIVVLLTIIIIYISMSSILMDIEIDIKFPDVAIKQMYILAFTLLVFSFHSLMISPKFKKKLNGKFQLKNIEIFLTVSVSGLLIAILYYISTHSIGYINWNAFRDIRQYFLYSVFFVEIGIAFYLLFWVIFKKDDKYNTLFVIVVAACSIMYIHGMSYVIEDHAMLLSLSLFLCFALTVITNANWLKNIAVYSLCLLSIIVIFIQKASLPYIWWAVNAVEPIYDSTESYADPLLQGLKGSISSATSMNEIYTLLKNNSKEGDTLYSFPNSTYFNVMADLNSTTFAKVHYFDVCSDPIASKDAENLLSNNPTFIVWFDMTEEAWLVHEKIFRDSKSSGQRDIQDAYNYLTKSKRYVLLWKGKIDNSDPIYIWGLKDGRNYVTQISNK